MPQARKSTSSARTGTFTEPAALKRLERALDTAQTALTELGKDTGRDVSTGARDLYKDLRTFITSARRNRQKLARALRRDFEQAQKKLASTGQPSRPASRPATRRRASGTATKRSTSKRR